MSTNFIESERGDLYEINFQNVPFHVNRIFIVDNVKVGEIRGEHAHYQEQQLIICLKGKIQADWITFNNQKGSAILSSKDELYSHPMTWLKLTFLEENSSFACLCSSLYNEDDYIRDFDKFQELINEKV